MSGREVQMMIVAVMGALTLGGFLIAFMTPPEGVEWWFFPLMLIMLDGALIYMVLIASLVSWWVKP